MNIIQVDSSSILLNDNKFGKNDYSRADRNENTNIKSIVLPRIQTPSYKNIPQNTRNSNNYGHHLCHDSDLTSNFNMKYMMIQKSGK